MPPEFQFFLLCLTATQREEDKLITLNGIVNGVYGSTSRPVELTAAIGLFLPRVVDVSLAARGWRFDEFGDRQSIAGMPDVCIDFPDADGVVVGAEQLFLTTPESGVYGLDLLDTHGLFSTPGKLLARYVFPVKVRD